MDSEGRISPFVIWGCHPCRYGGDADIGQKICSWTMDVMRMGLLLFCVLLYEWLRSVCFGSEGR